MSRNNPHFIVPESSLPFSHKPDTCPYPGTNQYPLRLPISLRFILILSSHTSSFFSGCSFPSGYEPKCCVRVSLASTRATCPTHIIILDLITALILGEGYIPCIFLQYPPTPYLFISRLKNDANMEMVEKDHRSHIRAVRDSRVTTCRLPYVTMCLGIGSKFKLKTHSNVKPNMTVLFAK